MGKRFKSLNLHFNKISNIKIILFALILCGFLAVIFELADIKILSVLNSVWKAVYLEILLIVLHAVWSIAGKKEKVTEVVFNKNYKRIFAVTLAVWMVSYLPAYSAENYTIGKMINKLSNKNTQNIVENNEYYSDTQHGEYEIIEQEKTEETVEKSIFLTDPDKFFQLNQEETNAVYFLDGKYKIVNWENGEEVRRIICNFVSDLRQQHYCNQFDENAPESLKGEVSRISELEAKMQNSTELETVIDIRKNAYSQYSKYTLSRLIANNQQLYALSYARVQGHWETVEYYYAQSIFWLFNCLKFDDIDDYTIKSIFSSIEMRYHDIAQYVKKDSLQSYRATILSNTFKSLENQYIDTEK